MAKSQKRVKLREARRAKPTRSSGAQTRERVARTAPAVPARSKLERVRMPAAKTTRPGTAQVEDVNEGKYVYCIIKSAQPLDFGLVGIGIEPAEVHTVHFRDIAAVVSNTPMV